MQTLSQKLITKHQWLVHTLYGQKYWDNPSFRTEKGTSKTVATKMETQLMHLKISISVATVLEVSKMTVPICTSHWCLVMSFWLKVCIYSHTRGVKLGLGLGFMQTSQVLPHWLNQSFLFGPCLIHRGIVMSCPNCCYNIRSTQFPRIS